MKKIVFSLMGLAFCGFAMQAQHNGTISGTVVDAAQQPVPGVAVFYYGVDTDPGSANSFVKEEFIYNTYTDGNGNYTLNYYANSLDTVGVGVLDCNQNMVVATTMVQASNPNRTNVNLQINCLPGACNAVIKVDSMMFAPTLPPMFEYTAVALRDSAYANINTPVNQSWTYNGITRSSVNTWQGPNSDSIWIFSQTRPVNVCYQRMPSCTPICINVPPTPGHSCNADFYVDTVNSINFQGQIVIWENSTTDTGATIIGHRWDFGDGNTSSVQYPTHTYNDTGIYNVCLTIVSVDGTDTCTSTFCDSIGFDAQGNLVYKKSQQGFTINVIDRATVGQQENALQSSIDLYPNPSNGEAVLTWNPALAVQQVDVMSISGELVRSIAPKTSSVELQKLSTGIYIIRIQSKEGVTSRRMIVH